LSSLTGQQNLFLSRFLIELHGEFVPLSKQKAPFVVCLEGGREKGKNKQKQVIKYLLN